MVVWLSAPSAVRRRPRSARDQGDHWQVFL